VYTYGIFGRDITRYTVIYGVYNRFWPTLAGSAPTSGAHFLAAAAVAVVGGAAADPSCHWQWGLLEKQLPFLHTNTHTFMFNTCMFNTFMLNTFMFNTSQKDRGSCLANAHTHTNTNTNTHTHVHTKHTHMYVQYIYVYRTNNISRRKNNVFGGCGELTPPEIYK
jgi:hypothetical protein